MNRRTFLSASVISGPAAVRGSVNDEIQVGIVGARGRGRYLIREFAKLKGCRIGAVCDVDNSVGQRAVQTALEVQSARPKLYQDLRKLFDDKSIDAVAVSTCNHWHALATVWACQAGKDVYVEKPVSHNLWEGRKMIEAARKYERMVQVGVQARTIRHYQRAFELLHAGAIGKLYLAKAVCFKRRRSIGRHPDGPVPEGVDYDLWLGPVSKRPFNPNRFHYNWHWFWATGNGDLGNQCVHEVELARYGLRKNELPVQVYSSGAKFAYDDDQETPNTQLAIYDYDDCRLMCEVRGLFTGTEASLQPENGNFTGVLYFGTEGYLSLDCFGFQMYLGEKRELVESMKHAEAEPWSTVAHLDNFLRVARSRRAADLNCRIEDGHVSAGLVHIANISYRLGRSLRFDPRTERFTGDSEANAQLSREYRAPYILPERV